MHQFAGGMHVGSTWQRSGSARHGLPYPRFDILSPPSQLFCIRADDGRDRTQPVEAFCTGLCPGRYQGRPCVYLANSYGVYIIDPISREVVTKPWGKAFDVAWDSILYIASHGYGSGDCLFALDPETGDDVWESPENFVEGGLVVWAGELYLACGSEIRVLDGRTFRDRRVLRIAGYRNGPMAPSTEGLWLMLGDHGGTDRPQIKDGSELSRSS